MRVKHGVYPSFRARWQMEKQGTGCARLTKLPAFFMPAVKIAWRLTAANLQSAA
jgi:hypothetical protein